jgi:ABC-type transport system substrate-binding protein
MLLIWILFCINTPVVHAQNVLWGNQWSGPWVDKIVCKPLLSDQNPIFALVEGEIDIIGNDIDQISADELRDVENIAIMEELRYGYGITAINCAKYPMNITNFRRAVAFALDKNEIVSMSGAALLDCHIPRQNPACIEEEMTYHYYDENMGKGRELLTDAGFIDTDNDAWLEGPSLDGPGTIELDPIIVEFHPGYPRSLYADTVYQALLNLGIPAELKESLYNEYISRLEYHREYDMVFHGRNWITPDLDGYALDYLSEYREEPYYNVENW